MKGSPVIIALDVMGGDHAPRQTVRGAAAFVTTRGDAHVLLVGRGDEIRDEIEALSRDPAAPTGTPDQMEIVEATEVIGMDEHPAAAVRAKRDSSVLRACQMVSEGRAHAAVSAGNSGALLAAGLFALRRIPGVSRPAIGALVPNRAGQTFMLDIGANVDCRPRWLAQFAIMGNVYARTMMGLTNPRVALLSNGEESSKGSELIQAAHPLLGSLPLNFVGNVEGRGLFGRDVDVAVTDGFTGNVALKTAEGVAEFLFSTLRHEARSSLPGMLGGLLLRSRLRPLRDRVDYRKTGGALLLGVRGEAVIAHGRSDAEAITNALRVAADAVHADVSGTIATAFEDSALVPTDSHTVSR